MNHYSKGFTLVELAIVLMIIGLLIGGVLRGQEMLQNAKITTTLEHVKAYEAAYHSFVDTYNNYPGDMALAITKIPGCNAGNFCQNGNGDSVIGIPTNDVVLGAPWYNIPNAIASENTQFWKHLALAHLISGVNPSASVPEWGKSHPTAPINAGFFARTVNFPGIPGGPPMSGTLLVLRAPINGEWACGGDTNPEAYCAISPRRAAQMDRKVDDGIATTGNVIAVSSSYNAGCGTPNNGINGPTGYNETIETNACDMMFLF